MSENGILLLFYIFLSHGNEGGKNDKKKGGGKGGKMGDAVSCPQVPVGINTVYMYM
jgi:hypothetical protein